MTNQFNIFFSSVTKSDIIDFIGPFVLPMVMLAVAVLVGGAAVAFAIKNIKRQIKLHNSITLVELKSTRLHYVLFSLLNAFFIMFLLFQMVDVHSPEVVFFKTRFDMEWRHTNLMLGFLILLLVQIEFLLVVLTRSKCAIVDKGVHTDSGFLCWYDVHDYIIDEEKGIVILTSARETFSTIEGTTAPLKVSKNDIEKLKFILNKNKNRFSGFDGREHKVIN